MGQQIKRHIGQILLDGKFLSNNDIDHALEEQKHTRELLGQVLVRMGVLKARDINAPLLVQDHLSSIDDAVKMAAGERQLLGALLVRSGRITSEQLDHVIAEQKKSGEKLGEVFTRLGILTEQQLAALLEFQHNQEETATVSPLRLGELLVATGYISHDQLDMALYKQSISHKKIGEVLVEEGYVSRSRIKYGFRLQKMLVNSVLAAILSFGMGATAFASDVSLQWDANAESDLAGYKVYYSPESSPLESATPLDVNNQTIATISGLDPSKSYKFAVSAYNTSGVESPFSNIVTIAEQLPPTVDISSPATAGNVSGVVLMSVNASDNVGVTKVEFYVNGELKGSDTASPYVYSWDTTSLAPGPYTLMAKAYDAAGNISQSVRSVTVVNDLVPPAVALTSPANGATFSGAVTISSSASDNVGVTNVEFYCNGVLLYASNVSPYSYSWDTTAVGNGNYVIVAKAYDNAGNTTQSSSVTVTVNNPVPDITAPTLSTFTLPASATSLTVPISGFSASDNIGVTGFFVTESATAPSAGDSGWSGTAPNNFTFSSPGAKTAYGWVKDGAGNISSSRSASTTITLPDVTAPTLSTFTLPATASSLTVPISGFTASDNIGVTGYLVTESATAPSAGDSGWSGTAPGSFTFSSTGVKTAYGWVKDGAGNISISRSAGTTITLPDITAPTLSTFTLPATASSLTVPISGFTASDNIGVTGYLVTESATAPSAGDSGWSGTAPGSFTFSSTGVKTAYGWVKDGAGNISISRSAGTTITLPDITAPTLSTFTLPATASSLTVPISGFTASDNIGVTGYLVTESATAPSAGDSGWSGTAPGSFTFSSPGVKTAYGWVKDGAGNVSASRSAGITITLPDITAPMLNTFTLPATATSLTVPIPGFTASDNIGVTGYLVTESATAPSAGASGWSGTAPGSFTFSSPGVKTAYGWVKDGAGNISASRSAGITITLPDITAPMLNTFTLPATATSLTVPISGFTASDNIGVTGYLVTESATAPSAGDTGWNGTAPGSFTFSSPGVKTAYGWVKDGTGNVSASRSAGITITLPDITAPTLSTFTLPATASSLTVPISGFTASDNIGVTGYLVTESATAPSAGDSGWSGTAPGSFTFSSPGVKTAYGWVKDGAGNISSSRSAGITITLPDITAPTLSTFTLPATASSLTVPISGFTASDNIGVTGFFVTESATAPSAGDSGWSGTAPGSFTFSSAGAKTAYGWVKDGAGNVSASRSAGTTITLPDITAPTLSTFTLPATATSLTVPISGFTASDNIGVTGYLVTESATAPSAGDSGWSGTAPGSFTFSSTGVKTAYGWVKDGTGNVSASRSAGITITLPDTSLTISDALLALQVGSGKVKATAEQKTRLDVAPVIHGKSTPDGQVNTGDAIVILSKVVGKS